MRTVSHVLAKSVGVVTRVLGRRPDRVPAPVPATVSADHLAPPVAAGRWGHGPAAFLGESEGLLDIFLRVSGPGGQGVTEPNASQISECVFKIFPFLVGEAFDRHLVVARERLSPFERIPRSDHREVARLVRTD